MFNSAVVVTSCTLSLPELTARLGREPQSGSGSHNRGDQRGLPGQGLTWDRTIWRENAQDDKAPLYEQCSQLLQDMPPKCVELLLAEPNDIAVSLDIVVFYESAYVSFVLPSRLIRELCAKGIDVEVTVYPVDNAYDEKKEKERDTPDHGEESGTGPIK